MAKGNDFILAIGKKNTFDGGKGDDIILGLGQENKIKSGSGNDIVLVKGAKNSFVSLGGLNRIYGAGKNNTIQGGQDKDTIHAGGESNTYDAGAGDDTLISYGNNITLTGGAGNDTYQIGGKDAFGASLGANPGGTRTTTIDNRGDASTTDKLLLGANVDYHNIDFSRSGNDVKLNVSDTNEVVILKDWYTTPLSQQVDTIQISNGASLQSSQVNDMVKAWDIFEAAGSTLAAKTQLDSTLKQSWAV